MSWHRSFLTDFVFVFRSDKTKHAVESTLVRAKASQALDVGSIPVARSNKITYAAAPFSIFSKTTILLPNFMENSERTSSRGISPVYRSVIADDEWPIC